MRKVHPWKKFKAISKIERTALRNKKDMASIWRKESQRGMPRDILTHGLRCREEMSNDVLSNK